MIKLKPYQSTDINHHWWTVNNGRGILGWSVGTGKTFCGAYISGIILRKFTDSILIICPPSLIPTWCEMLDMNSVEYNIFHGTPKKRTEGNVTITTYDMMKKMNNQYQFIIADECHKIKSSTSKRGKFFQKIARQAEYLLMMTGTLSNKRDPEENLNYLWSIGVDGLPRNITQFRDRYSRYVGGGQIKFPMTMKEGATLIDREMKKVTAFRTLREVLPDLPEMQHIVRKVECEFNYKKMIQELATSMDVEVSDEGEVHIIKALQMANGISPISNEVEDFRKVEATVEAITEFGDEKVIVWVWWRAFTDSLMEGLKKKKISAVLVNGGVSNKQKLIDKFKGDTQVLVASLGSIAEGLNLQFCHNQIIANQWYDIIKDEQSQGRIERTGQESEMMSIRIVAKNSIEEEVVKVLKNKMSMIKAQDFLNGTLRQRYGGGKS